ncbi:MAG: vitamin K epoxide reductase family protein [Rhizonema sp. PD37]|nr:vitamin K epoxide reductase family protein [Rhizonema sp. PD37]
MVRRRSTPWIHRSSRLLIAAIAACGALTTGYLTIEKLTGGSVACLAKTGTQGCHDVLASPWATLPIFGGLPLSLFGFLAYISMAVFALIPLAFKTVEKKDVRQKLENWTWLLLLTGAIAMTVFSGYLMYLLAFQIKTFCPYCIASATFSLSLLVLTLIGRSWEDIGQIFFTAIIVGMVTLISTLGVYSQYSSSSSAAKILSPEPIGEPALGVGWPIRSSSGEAEIGLARHLTQIGAKEYIAWWCPHCHEQKELFGKEAYPEIKHIDCDPQGKDDPQPDVCQAVGIKGYPTWQINGKLYPNVQQLETLAQVSGYKGPRNFKNFPDAFKK